MSRMSERILAQAKKSKTKGTGVFRLPKEVKFFNPKAGTTRLSIIPYQSSALNDLNDMKDIYIHNQIGVDNKQYICPKTVGKKCPICEERLKLMNNYEENKELIRHLKPQRRVGYNVINVDEPEGIQFFCTSYYNFTELLFEELFYNEEYSGYAEPEQGKILKVRFKTETFNGREYVKAGKIDFENRDPLNEKTLKQAVDLDTCFEVLEYNELKTIFLELDGDELIEEEEQKTIEKVDEDLEEFFEEDDEEMEFPPKEEKEEVPEEPKIKRTKPSPCSNATCSQGKVLGKDFNKFEGVCDECNDDEWDKCRELSEKK